MPLRARTQTVALSALVGLVASPGIPAKASDTTPATTTGHADVVSETPVDWTPHVLDGSVRAVAEGADVIVAGGNFERIQEPDSESELTQRHLFAFERETGELLADFRPTLDGEVRSLAVVDDTVYVGGFFTSVNNVAQRGITQLSLSDGSLVSDFAETAIDDGRVYGIAEHEGQLYLGGSFSSVNGEARRGIARLDAATGEVDPDFDLPISELRAGFLRVHNLALSPDGERLLINGPFLEVAGQSRPQIAMIDTAGEEARLSSWSTNAFTADCGAPNMHTYLHQMEFAPDSSYFVVVTTGSAHERPGLCKTASRWEVTDNPEAEPTWVNETGGDSLYSVAVTERAVYVGGHQRWLDNPEGHNSAGPGAVDREGIGAIDPESGTALPWNPGRQRGHGAEELLATEDGLFVGSDTEWISGRYQPRLALLPLD